VELAGSFAVTVRLYRKKLMTHSIVIVVLKLSESNALLTHHSASVLSHFIYKLNQQKLYKPKSSFLSKCSLDISTYML